MSQLISIINDSNRYTEFIKWCEFNKIECKTISCLTFLWPLYEEYEATGTIQSKTIKNSIETADTVLEETRVSFLRWFFADNCSGMDYYTNILDVVKTIRKVLDDDDFYSSTHEIWVSLKYDQHIPFICEVLYDCIEGDRLGLLRDITSLIENGYQNSRFSYIISSSIGMYLGRTYDVDFGFIDRLLDTISTHVEPYPYSSFYILSRYYGHYSLSNHIYKNHSDKIYIMNYFLEEYTYLDDKYRCIGVLDMLKRNDYDFFKVLSIDIEMLHEDENDYSKLMDVISQALIINRSRAMDIFKLYYDSSRYETSIIHKISNDYIEKSDINVLVENLKKFGEYYGAEHLSSIIVKVIVFRMKQRYNIESWLLDRFKKMVSLITPLDDRTVKEYFIEQNPHGRWLWDKLFD